VAKIVASIDYWKNAPLWDRVDPKGDQDVVQFLSPRTVSIDAASRQFFAQIKTPSCATSVPRPRKRKVIMCHGTFDVVHQGTSASALPKTKADILVAVTGIHIKKGDMRPYVPEDLRAINLAALEMVDYVIIDRDPTPLRNLALIQPDYFAKGYEYTAGQVHPKTQEEINVLDSYGGEVIFTPGDIVYSSSAFSSSHPEYRCRELMVLMQAEGVTFRTCARRWAS
jgi:bifunctional ADP-heptose synthase (sugar kinase/adenylyltransferase)